MLFNVSQTFWYASANNCELAKISIVLQTYQNNELQNEFGIPISGLGGVSLQKTGTVDCRIIDDCECYLWCNGTDVKPEDILDPISWQRIYNRI